MARGLARACLRNNQVLQVKMLATERRALRVRSHLLTCRLASPVAQFVERSRQTDAQLSSCTPSLTPRLNAGYETLNPVEHNCAYALHVDFIMPNALDIRHTFPLINHVMDLYATDSGVNEGCVFTHHPGMYPFCCHCTSSLPCY